MENKENMTTQKNVKSSKAKMAGLKSSFAIGDDVVMTSFGRGNDAVVEKRISGGEVTDVNTAKPVFSVKVSSEKKFELSSKALSETAISDTPTDRKGMDAIRAKDMLEKKYFGKTFDDNVHIQIIYNIIDVLKILTVHSNNIVYELDNMFRRSEDEFDDFIGYMSTGKNYDDWCDECARARDLEKRGLLEKGSSAEKTLKMEKLFDEFVKMPQLSYFGNALYTCRFDKKTKKEVWELKPREELYAIIAMLGMVRQICTHSHMGAAAKLTNGDAWLYNLETLDDVDYLYLDVLDGIYEKAVKAVNSDFFKNNSRSNFAILKAIYPEMGEDEMIKKFYDFVVLKSYKSLGFSVKRLREAMLGITDRLTDEILSQKYDSVRSKLYQLFDFAIVRYFEANGELVDETVAKLRLAQNDDEKKNAVYAGLAAAVWPKINAAVNVIVRKMTGDEIRALNKGGEKIAYREIAGMLSPDAPRFCELVYLLSMFLDGKEINDLITTLINKFENIGSFLKTAGELGLDTAFVPDYKMFEYADNIATNLRDINSFCRMQKVLPNAKKVMYREAVEVLGVDMSDTELDALVDKLLNIGESGKKLAGETGLRNFIASNVIESWRFRYLIRYSNSKKVRAIAANKALVDFQLSRLPQMQIERYYVACMGKSDIPMEEKREYLSGLITGISFDEFKNVKQNTRGATREQMLEKQKKQGIISLYLTILYLITKNLVYVNSRYVMAFSAWQRDTHLYFKNSQNGQYFDLTKHFIANGWLKAHPCKYLAEDMAMTSLDAVRSFRNCAAHLNVVRNLNTYIGEIKEITSYYAIYHYVMQRMIGAAMVKFGKTLTAKEQKWLDAVSRYGTYSKDFVKALCTPFGYNLPRFKNLSICDLFDRNEMRETTETGEIKAEE